MPVYATVSDERFWRARLVACPHCKAQPYFPCTIVNSYRHFGDVMWIHHNSRYTEAAKLLQ